jgi:hypothetical protein
MILEYLAPVLLLIGMVAFIIVAWKIVDNT